MKEQRYRDPRPADHFARFHARVRARPPGWIYEVVRVLLTPLLLLFYRARCIDSRHIPPSGPVIMAPNHFSFLDHFFVAVYLRRKVQFMGKSQLFKRPMEWIYSHGGVFPIRRGHRDDEAFETAHAVLARGGVVVMYAEGGRSRSDDLGEPRSGIGRLALESGAPVVPTAIAGTARARNWRRLEFPKITVQYDKPIRFDRVEAPTREQALAAAGEIFDRVRGIYGRLRRGGRRRAVKAARAARRAAEATARRPVTE
jgi:1-acyl-sn-glycerol-3-phosphate acyltransferase